MSEEFPIIAIVGSSGSGSTAVTRAFEHIFYREGVIGAYIQGSAFHRFSRCEMEQKVQQARAEGRVLTHFSPEANHLDKLETLFFQYAATGTGVYRFYLHSAEAASEHDQPIGTLTPWQQLREDTDLLLYRGLHGAAIQDDIDIGQYPDLLIGMTPNVNLEWIRKISRDSGVRGYSREEVKQSILERMHDYAHYMTPQFTRTHINLQMVAAVDTSDPFAMEDMPINDECMLVIHFQNFPEADFPTILNALPGSHMTRRDTLVVPGDKITSAIQTILMPHIRKMIQRSQAIRGLVDQPPMREGGLLNYESA